MVERSYIMMGSLSNFAVREVLDVVSLSRQHTVIELCGTDGSTVASVNLKAGHLVQGTSHGVDPKEELYRALQASDSCTFQVFRMDDSDVYRSCGELEDLLADERLSRRALTASAVVESLRGPVGGEAPPTPTAMRPSSAQPRVAPIASLDESSRSRPIAVESTAKATHEPTTLGVSLAVASPKGGVGKTTIALNLGISLANRGLDVIIIDADINGDLLSLIDARGSVEVGSFDLLQNSGQLDGALRRTVVKGLRVLPAGGRDLPASALSALDRTAEWGSLIRRAVSRADVVLVDCPAGMFHPTLEILRNVSYVLGVFQAETVASRSFEMFERGLAALSESERPRVAGVVVNMLRDDSTSARLHEDLVAADTSRRVLETAIGRSEAFEIAAVAGKPVRLYGGRASRRVASVFDELASELVLRLHLVQPPAESTGSFIF